MARQRSHSIAFKRQGAQEFIAGESLHALSKRHDISRQLKRPSKRLASSSMLSGGQPGSSIPRWRPT